MAKAQATKRAVNDEKKAPVYQRMVLKISGESLQGPAEMGIHGETVMALAREIKEVRDLGVQVAWSSAAEIFFAA